jgi:UDP-N-acetylmuramyl pentapeptide phosphotransferase/UDP-N-acetylglucosamine-1-phosphate transferase
VYYIIGDSLWRMPLAVVFGVIASYLACFPVIHLSHRLHILDRPGERSSHKRPTPRSGGIAIIFGALVGVACVFSFTPAFLLVTLIGAVVAAVSFVDDVYSVRPSLRLAIQTAVAAASIYTVRLSPEVLALPFVTIELGPILGYLLALLVVVGFVNAFNFIDGMNGLAASQGVWGGITISLLLFSGHSGNSVFTAAALSGACLGFLPHNFPRAKLFMGDIGAITVGFGLAMLTLVGAARTDVPWIAFLLPLSLTIYDPLFTVIKRICQGHNPLVPHREFHFHLLLRCGWTHDDNTRLQNILMAVSGLAGLIYAWPPAPYAEPIRLALLCGIALMLATYSVWVHVYFMKHRLDRQEQQAPEADFEVPRAELPDGNS